MGKSIESISEVLLSLNISTNWKCIMFFSGRWGSFFSCFKWWHMRCQRKAAAFVAGFAAFCSSWHQQSKNYHVSFLQEDFKQGVGGTPGNSGFGLWWADPGISPQWATGGPQSALLSKFGGSPQPRQSSPTREHPPCFSSCTESVSKCASVRWS